MEDICRLIRIEGCREFVEKLQELKIGQNIYRHFRNIF